MITPNSSRLVLFVVVGASLIGTMGVAAAQDCDDCSCYNNNNRNAWMKCKNPNQDPDTCEEKYCNTWDYVSKKVKDPDGNTVLVAGKACEDWRELAGFDDSKKYCRKQCCRVGIPYKGDECCSAPDTPPTPQPNDDDIWAPHRKCTNEASQWMKDRGMTCEDAKNTIYYRTQRCNCKYNDKGEVNLNWNWWKKNKYCRKMCYEIGKGYDGDDCWNAEVDPRLPAPYNDNPGTGKCWPDFTDVDVSGCTHDTKLCPDGKTYVGRVGPNCEFEQCPSCPNDRKRCPWPYSENEWMYRNEEKNCEFDKSTCSACNDDEYKCWDEKFVKRDPDNYCKFEQCSKYPICPSNVKVCWDKSVLNPDPKNDCKFPPCPPCDKYWDYCPAPYDESKQISTNKNKKCIFDYSKCPCKDGTKRCPNGDIVRRNPDNYCKFEDCQGCGLDKKLCPNGITYTTRDLNTCEYRPCCDKHKKQCWNGQWTWPNQNCEWVNKCPSKPNCGLDKKMCPNGITYTTRDLNTCEYRPCCVKHKKQCWDGQWTWPNQNCEWVNKCPSKPVACPYETKTCWNGKILSRNANDHCNFPSCPDRPSYIPDLPGPYDKVQLRAYGDGAYGKDRDLHLCMKVDSRDYSEGTVIEFDGCKSSDHSQQFYVRRVYDYDDEIWYILPANTSNDLYVAAVDVPRVPSKKIGSQGKMKLKEGKQETWSKKTRFFFDYSDAPYDNDDNNVFRMGVGEICYPDDDGCLFVTNNNSDDCRGAVDNGKIVVRTWDRIKRNALEVEKCGNHADTVFGKWKLKIVYHHR